MNLIKANKIKYTEKKPFPQGEVIGKRWIIVGENYQVAMIKGKFFARNVNFSTLKNGLSNPKYSAPDKYFGTLKEAVKYAQDNF